MSKSIVPDYSVYLVTDSTPEIIGHDGDICKIVESAIHGGVSIVQYRDKNGDSQTVLETAKKLHQITKRYGVPLLINDRVELAVEVGCEGVHIGQDDMSYVEARQKLGKDKIIGVSASSEEEAIAACAAGADYLGIGAVYATSTKKDTTSILGPTGIRKILSALAAAGHVSVPTVCIGGVNASNIQSTMLQSRSLDKSLDGVAIVSAIMAASDPAAAAGDLLAKVLVAKIPDVIVAVAKTTPLSHNMTNLVVQNFAANVGLAVGASPIMANYGAEAEDLAKVGGALVINMGTVTPDGLEDYIQAIKAYNKAQRPILLDPVGAGATEVRRSATGRLLSSGHFTVIKGNEGEIQTIAGSTVQQRGVDSSTSLNPSEKADLVRSVARQRGNVVLMTGKSDFVSDGRRTICIDNGHELLAAVTGTGCTLGTTISAMLGANLAARDSSAEPRHTGDALLSTVAGLLLFEVAAEMAAVRNEVRGPGTFVPAFIDELFSIRQATLVGDLRWLTLVKLHTVLK